MNSKYENESFLSTGSNAYYDKEEASSLLQHNGEEEYMSDRKKIERYKTEGHGKCCNKYTEEYYLKKRNKKWNYFLIFFLGMCFGFAVWPFFMTIITYKLFYTDHSGGANFKTRHTPSSHRTTPPSASSSSSNTSSSTTTPSTNLANNSQEKKNNARIPTQEQQKKHASSHFKPIRFDEIAGIDESKIELLEVVDFIKNREKYYQMGARMPKGVLLVGPPGSGKTMLARAVATEANVPYIYTSGPEFIEIYVGQGAKRIRQLFAHARSVAPAIVFIDEIDAVGGKRSSGSSGSGTGQREHDQTLNQLLVEMDGFNNSTNIMIIGATNRIDTLDSALLRPGRFDRIVYVPLPDVNGRKKILEIYVKKIKSSLKEEDILKIARLTPGFSGADLENIVNEATILATRNRKEFVTLREMNEARDKVSMGPERRSLRLSDHQRRITAYHEAGHAIVAYFLHPKTDPIHKATIISRGSALGYVEQIPMDDKHNYFKSQMEAKLAVCMGGRTAEEIVFGKTEASSGASSDISSATEIAYKMVTEWGMSDKLGPLNYKKRLGDGYSVNRLSAKTIAIIEMEVKNLVEKGKTLSEEILRKHRKELDNLAFALLDRETLSGEEIKKIIDPNNTNDYTTSGSYSSEKTTRTNKSNSINIRDGENVKDDMNNTDIMSSVDGTSNTNSFSNDTFDKITMDNNSQMELTEKNRNAANDINKEKIDLTNNKDNIAEVKKIAQKDIGNVKLKNIQRAKNELNKSKRFNYDAIEKQEYKEKKDNEASESFKDSNLFSNKGHGNILKNINKLYELDFIKKEKHGNTEDYLKEKINKVDSSSFSSLQHIDNMEEMKKFSIFEHNLNKIFLFDIFNNFQ